MEDLEKAEELFDIGYDYYLEDDYDNAIKYFNDAAKYGDWSFSRQCRDYVSRAQEEKKRQSDNIAEKYMEEAKRCLMNNDRVTARWKFSKAIEECYDPAIERECKEYIAEIDDYNNSL